MKVGLLSVEARTAEGKIADAQKDAANANDRAGQANKAAAEAKERAAALEVQAADLERAISPRIIDQGQMSRSLRPFSGVTVRTLVVFDFEARRLGATLNVGLKMAGWNPFLLQNSSASIPDGVKVVYAGSIPVRNFGLLSEQGFRSIERGERAANAIVASLKQDNIVAIADRFEGRFLCQTGAQDVCAAFPAPGEVLTLIGAKPLDSMITQKQTDEFFKRDPSGNVFFGNE